MSRLNESFVSKLDGFNMENQSGFKDISQDFELEKLDWMIVPFEETGCRKRNVGGKG